MLRRSAGALVVGREAELSSLSRVLEDNGPRVCFVYGITGMGKSWLLDRFGQACASQGLEVFTVDCRSIDPTEQGFLEGLRRAMGTSSDAQEADDVPLRGDSSAAVLLIDTYELFRLSDPWLRHTLLPRLGPSVRVVVAGREPPMLEWSVERGQLGGVEVLPLGPLDPDSVAAIVRATGLAEGLAADEVARVSRGHPLALRLALEARLAGDETSEAESVPRAVDSLARAFRAGLDEPARQALDAASVPRRITLGVLAAMLGTDAAAQRAVDILEDLPFVQAASDGLVLHDAVQAAVVARLRAVNPDQFRRYRTAAWHHLQTATRGVARHELARSTADLLFLIDNPVVREAMFPTTAHLYSVEPSRPEDAEGLRAIWHRHEQADAAAVLDLWLERAPGAVRAVRDRSGSLAGCVIVAEWASIPRSLERDDPVVAGWAKHKELHPPAAGQITLVLRRALALEVGEGPSAVQAASWLDVKRDYLRLRPRLGRVYTVLVEPAPFLDAFDALGIRPCGTSADIGVQNHYLAALDMGIESVDGWLSGLAAAELGIEEEAFLDSADRSVGVGDHRIQLSPLEFGVLETLSKQRGRPVSRADLLQHVWGTDYSGASNVVDVVVRSLRHKLGASAGRVETARGVGYRFN